MKVTNLGEFEEIVLPTIEALVDDAYSVAICDELEKKSIGHPAKLGVVHAVMNRLEEKAALLRARDMREQLWSRITELVHNKA